MEILFTIEKLWYYGQNYGNKDKTMALWKKIYRELWNFNLRRNKNMVDYQKLRTFDL